MRTTLKRLIVGVGVVLLVLIASLVYSFVPKKIDFTAYESDATSSSAANLDPGKLPNRTLSIIRAGKMPARKLFAYRGGGFNEAYENGMVAILVRHPRATFLIDSGFGTNVDRHWQTIPWL